jgi:hypothetical protein
MRERMLTLNLATRSPGRQQLQAADEAGTGEDVQRVFHNLV